MSRGWSQWKKILEHKKAQARQFKQAKLTIRSMQLNRCILCWQELDPPGTINNNAMTFHHIVYKGQGGTDTLDNLVGTCRSCHDAIHFPTMGDSFYA